MHGHHPVRPNSQPPRQTSSTFFVVCVIVVICALFSAYFFVPHLGERYQDWICVSTLWVNWERYVNSVNASSVPNMFSAVMLFLLNYISFIKRTVHQNPNRAIA